MNGSRMVFAIAVLVLGAALGLGAYTFAYARGWAYMTDDPRACANCHVMNAVTIRIGIVNAAHNAKR